MSGDLKEPAKSLPTGTLAAIGVGFIVYFAQLFLMGGAGGRDELAEHPYRFLVASALFGMGFMILVGVVAATLSSALGSLVGAPRVLQALGRDRLLCGGSPLLERGLAPAPSLEGR